MDKYLREWRQKAQDMNQHEAASFVGDKLVALSASPDDVYALAQSYVAQGHFSRAQSLLATKGVVEHSSACKYLAALCLLKQHKYEEALHLLGDSNPVHLISDPNNPRRKLRHGGTAARATRIDQSEERDRTDPKAEAGMCFLRGQCYVKNNAFDKAKECFKIAVRIDVQCYEAFDALMKNALLSSDEEWDFLDSLDFDSITVGDGRNQDENQEAAQFTRLLYSTRLSKYSHPTETIEAVETLSTHYKLAHNADIMLARASLLFTQCRFRDALQATTAILEADPDNIPAMPVHVACLHELGEKNSLHILAHTLAESHPNEPVTYLAIGVYYLTINQISEARRFFSKSSTMDPHFGPAWIGFAHTFAAEGEHDQAISAYSTALRLFQGTHLPNLFMGMQNLALGNLRLAKEYLRVAWTLCKTDPLLINELGVVAYHENDLTAAIDAFTRALQMATALNSDPHAWLPTRTNLAHALRRARRYAEAHDVFVQVLQEGGRDCAVFSALGLTCLELGDLNGAIRALHEALAVNPQDAVATDLLARAMEFWGEGEEEVDEGGEREADARIAEVANTVRKQAQETRRRSGRVKRQARTSGT
ncbi:TPR-like protein [Trichodelitschia bisporula]|uniref:TPR-like protein n=1 Tax=Trichodelitschia bisporula TaxID=703511 RepID=A0A6G1I4Q3_9PEZI|nr:TPR-like protein [Trichodelitschia bisporula]